MKKMPYAALCMSIVILSTSAQAQFAPPIQDVPPLSQQVPMKVPPRPMPPQQQCTVDPKQLAALESEVRSLQGQVDALQKKIDSLVEWVRPKKTVRP